MKAAKDGSYNAVADALSGIAARSYLDDSQ
jgi:hypothetical protein